MADDADPSLARRQLKTLVLTDLCDSVALIERIGDNAAAELFRDLDTRVLQLLQVWNGRLIDRSDGMFLLFDAPASGLGFALDYQQALQALGAERSLSLQARVGLHVGYVLSWQNSDEAVAVGAKPLEVEGLAKSMAARLMNLARPGQILLSPVAESLLRGNLQAMGERRGRLQWKSHGRWRFKGVPAAQEVFEVGEAGRAPMRMPAASAKARRELPMWRRPLALVAEVVLVAALAITAWVMVRPEPAIAFAERDWVVLADLENRTGNIMLDDSVTQAFRVSLEQSRYVNVLSDMKTRDTLSRMRRDPATTRLDRKLASEVAMRDGARLVILPSASEVGGKLRLSVELVDPRTQATVRTEMMEGASVGSVLGSVDGLASRLRTRLGESAVSVKAASDPLPAVTTSNLQALRAYALGLRNARDGNWQVSRQMYLEAARIDPDFAQAYLGIARAHAALSERPKALPWLDKALALRARLPDRERLYLDAWQAELRMPSQALEKWQVMAGLYPDDFAGQANAAWHLYVANRFDEALPYADAADVPQDPLRNYAADYVGRLWLAKGMPDRALAHFTAAGQANRIGHARRVAAAYAVMDRHADAERILEGVGTMDSPGVDLLPYIERVSIALDQGHWQKAEMLSERARTASRTSDPFVYQQFQLIRSVVDQVQLSEGRQQRRELVARGLSEELAQASWDPQNRGDLATMLLVNAGLGLRDGNTRLAQDALARIGRLPDDTRYSVLSAFERILRAGVQGESGDLEGAIALLSPRPDDMYQSRVMLYGLLSKAGRHAEAEAQARWLSSQRGRAYIEANASQALQPLNVADAQMASLWLAESLAAQGKTGHAGEEVARLLARWPQERMPPQLRSRAEAILSASKQKITL